MSFTSANLKLIYEYLMEAGYGLSASEVGQLFQAGQLDELLELLQAHLAEITDLQTAIAETHLRLEVPNLPEDVRESLTILLATQEAQLEELLRPANGPERWY